MFSGSRKKEQAWRFMHFVASLPAQRIVAGYQRSVPALKEGREAFVEANPRVHAGRFVEALEYSRFQPITVHWPLMRRELTSEVDLMLDGHQTVRQTLDALVENEHLRERFAMPGGDLP